MGSNHDGADVDAGESLIECHTDLSAFFHDTLRSALSSRRVEAPPPTERYLVDLLADLGHDETVLSQSLVALELESQELTRDARLEHLRALGDRALSISGLFDPHLERRGLSRAYVSELGSRAYRHASHLAGASPRGPMRACATVFFDLSAHFCTYANVLDDVREATALGTRDDVLSLYERYAKTGSPALLSKLFERGVLQVTAEGCDTDA
jgi:hypothetical protein